VSKRGLKMAQERIQVIEEFIQVSEISNELKNMARGNAYYMAARISYFDYQIPAKKFLFLAFKNRKQWVEEAKIYEILYILLLPFSRSVNPIIDFLFEKLGRSNYGT
jgi:hypothetical protein